MHTKPVDGRRGDFAVRRSQHFFCTLAALSLGTAKPFGLMAHAFHLGVSLGGAFGGEIVNCPFDMRITTLRFVE